MNAGVLGLFWLLAPGSAPAQLAITEAMASSTNRLGQEILPALSDFWELTNFGDEGIPLDGYRWNDNAGGLEGDAISLDGLFIGPGESIIFVQSSAPLMTDPPQFREWWGPTLPQNLQIIPYTGNGFSAQGDGIRLWAPDARDVHDVVDSVDFGESWPGHTLTYDPETGLFGQSSVEGTGGAFKALTRDDVGSPGFTTGPVPLSITSHPADATVCAGVDVTFSVTANGLPRAKYQWFHDGQPILGAVSANLTIMNPQSTDAGQYEVDVHNVTGAWRSRSATLRINAEESPPVITTPFADVSVLVGETARFIAPVCAYPVPTFAWSTNGVALPEATSRTLILPKCDLALSGTLICVRVVNPLGSTSLCAKLIVSPKPKLFFTEVMGYAATNCPAVEQEDWFEVTNFDDRPVNLLGYRFASGNGFAPSLVGARKVTEPVLLQPGQSAIFVRNLKADQFRRWWGTDALPPDLPIIPFTGLGIRSIGDELYLWGPGTEDPTDFVASVAFAAFDPGVSKRFECRFDPNAPVCFAGQDGVVAEDGAFPTSCGDIGSPGYTTNPPPRLVRVERGALGVSLRWRGIPGRTYRLEGNSSLTETNWTPLGEHRATDFDVTATDPAPASLPQRFYRLEELRFP